MSATPCDEQEYRSQTACSTPRARCRHTHALSTSSLPEVVADDVHMRRNEARRHSSDYASWLRGEDSVTFLGFPGYVQDSLVEQDCRLRTTCNTPRPPRRRAQGISTLSSSEVVYKSPDADTPQTEAKQHSYSSGGLFCNEDPSISLGSSSFGQHSPLRQERRTKASCSTPRARCRHTHGMSTSSSPEVVFGSPAADDVHTRRNEARRHSSDYGGWLCNEDSPVSLGSSSFLQYSLDIIPDAPGLTSLGSDSLADLLADLEYVAAKVRRLPIPMPSRPTLSDLYMALELPMQVDIPDLDAISANAGYDEPLGEPHMQVITVEDSGYVSEHSSPAFSSPAFSDAYSDCEDTPRVHRPRAPSPLTPVTPNFAFSPALPRLCAPVSPIDTEHRLSPGSHYVSRYDDSLLSPASATFSFDSAPSPSSPLLSPSSATFPLDAAPAPDDAPSKSKFRPLKNMLLARRRGATSLKDIHVPSFADPLPGVPPDVPHSAASFFEFPDTTRPKRYLRRQISENLLSSRKTAADAAPELESFLMF